MANSPGIRTAGFPAAASYASKHLESYERLQRSQQRPAAVRSAIEELFTGDTLTRFDVAHSGVRKTELGVSSASAAAMEIRTFLDGVQGQLFSAARKHPQQSMNWEIMARALFDRPCDATMLNQLLAQGPLRSELIDELSGIGKRRTAHDQNDLKNVWMRSLDHVFIVLNLLRIRRARNP